MVVAREAKVRDLKVVFDNGVWVWDRYCLGYKYYSFLSFS